MTTASEEDGGMVRPYGRSPRVSSFSIKHGPEPYMDENTLFIDARSVKNPYVHGVDAERLRDIVLDNAEAQRLIAAGVQYLNDNPDGSVAVGCSYGHHRSVAIGREIARLTGGDLERFA